MEDHIKYGGCAKINDTIEIKPSYKLHSDHRKKTQSEWG